MACDILYDAELPECAEVININGYLVPFQTIVYTITSDSAIEYTFEAIPDSLGAFSIDTSLFKPGYFNHYRGLFTLTAKNKATNEPVRFKLGAIEVDSIVLKSIPSNEITTTIG